jgi:hypothetical protein
MAIVSSFDYAPFNESDPDDFRPNSHWAMLVDPRGNSDAHVDNIPAPGTETDAPQPAFTIDARVHAEA